MNLNLKHNSVAFYQLSKLLCIPCTLFLERVIYTYFFKGNKGVQRSELSLTVISSIVFISLGVALMAEGEIAYNFTGLVYMGLGVICTSVAQVWFAPLRKELNLNSLQLLFHTSPWMAFSSFVLAPFTEDTLRLLEFEMNRFAVLALSISCMMAFLLNVTNYKVLQVTSPLAYQVLGHVKTIAILLIGIFIFNEKPTSRVIAGMILGCVGMVTYGYEMNKKLIHDTLTTKVAIPKNDNKERIDAKYRPSISPDGKKRKSLIDSLTISTKSVTKRDRRVSMSGVINSPERKRRDSSNMHSWTGTSESDYDDDENESNIKNNPSSNMTEEQVRDNELRRVTTELNAIFKLRANSMSDKTLKLNDKDKLLLYSYYKYTEAGPCKTQKPGMFDPVGRAKWISYNDLNSTCSPTGGPWNKVEAMKA